jgi:hypothetical protein
MAVADQGATTKSLECMPLGRAFCVAGEFLGLGGALAHAGSPSYTRA